MKNSTLLIALTLLVPATASAQKKITYEEHVKPIFRAKCFNCHNTDKKSSDLDLTNYTAVMAGGAAGADIEPGDADSSYLFALVNHDDEPKMPPNSEKIDQKMIDTLRAWINGGALENSASKAKKKKAGPNLALGAPATGRPEGAPPLPDVLGLSPVVMPKANTAVEAIATSPWAPLIAVSSQKQIVLYHSTDLQPLAVLPFPEGVPEVLRFSRNGKLLLAGGGRAAFQGKVVVYDVKTGKRMIEVGDEVDSVLAADISSDMKFVALGGPSKMVRVYNTSDGSLAYEIKKHTDWVYDLEFSPDSVFLASSDRAGGLHVWEADNGRLYLTLLGHKGGVTSVSWRSDSNLLASGSMDTTIKLWEMENGKAVKSWGSHGGGAMSVEFCRDGRIVSCGRDRTTKIWDANGKQQRAFEAFGEMALKVSFCDETNRVIAGDWHGNIRVWNAADGKRLGELAQNPPALPQRLAAAKADLAAKEKDATAKATAAATAIKARDNVNNALAANKKLLTDSTNLHKQAKQQVPALTKALQTIKKQMVAATAAQTSLAKAVPQLKTAAAQVKTAAAAVPKDKELAALVASVQKKYTQKQAEYTAAMAMVKTKTTEQTQTNTKLAAMQKQMKNSAANMKKAQGQIKALTPQVKPRTDAANKAVAVSTAATAAHNTAKSNITRWNNYIALEGELAKLKQAETVLNEKEVAAFEMAEKLKTVQTALDGAKKAMTDVTNQHKATVAQAEQMKQTIAALNAESAKAMKHAKDLEANLPKLKDIQAKLAEAAKLVPDDTDIAASAQQMVALVTQKTAAIGTLKQTSTAKTESAKKTTAAMQTVLAKATELQKSAATATTKVAKMTKDMQPVVKATEAANAQVTSAKQVVDAAAGVVETRRQQIRPLLGFKTAQAG